MTKIDAFVTIMLYVVGLAIVVIAFPVVGTWIVAASEWLVDGIGSVWDLLTGWL